MTTEFRDFYHQAIQRGTVKETINKHDPRESDYRHIPSTASTQIPIYERVMTTATDHTDSGVTPRHVEGLLATQVLARIGARMVDIGKFDTNSHFPYESAGLTTEWLAEDASVTKADAGFSPFAISPHVVGCGVQFSRLLKKQNIYDTAGTLESMTRRDLGKAAETAFFNGSGASNQPLGLLNNTTIAAAAIDATAGMSAALFDNGIEALEDSEAEQENLYILTNPDTKKDLKSIAYHGDYLWTTNKNNQYCGGIRALTQRGIPDGVMLIGDFSKALIVTSGTFDINSISAKGSAVGASGGTEMFAFLTLDIVVGQTSAFQIIENI